MDETKEVLVCICLLDVGTFLFHIWLFLSMTLVHFSVLDGGWDENYGRPAGADWQWCGTIRC
jgi:hypothetical protein